MGMGTTKSTKNVPVPPDGGWGWAVVFASFMIHVIADGVAYTFGLFFSEISNHLGASKSATAWVASIMAGVTYGAGPLASAFVNRFGCRAVSAAGSVIAAVGFAISYFANSVLYLYLSVGLIGGLGLGLIYLPAIVSVTCYFEKKRSFATGIAVCGSGFGTMLLAPVIKLLLVHLAWRGAFLVTGGIILNCLFFSFMFRPLATVTTAEVAQDAEEPLDPSRTGQPQTINIIEPQKKAGVDAEVATNEPEGKLLLGNGKTPQHKSMLQVPSETMGMSSSQPALQMGVGSMESLKYATHHNKKRHSLKMPFQSHGNFTTVDAVDAGGSGIGSHNRHKRHSHAHVNLNNSHSVTTTTHGLILERKDVFYSGSLLQIPDFNTLQEEKSSLDSSDAPSDNDDSPTDFQKSRKIFGCIPCSPRFYNVFTKMLSISLLKDPIFLLFAISNFLTSIGYNVPYIYLVDMAEENANTDKVESTEYLLSIVGIANTASRIVLGYLSDKKWVNRLFLYNSALTLCGIATIGAAFTPSMNMLRVYSASFGALVGVYVSLTSVILVDLLGLDKLTNAFGLLLLFQGIGTIIGPPIVGKLFDEFKDYKYGFGVAGGMIALSGLMLFVIPCIQKRQENRKLCTKANMEQGFASESLIPNSDLQGKKTQNRNNSNSIHEE